MEKIEKKPFCTPARNVHGAAAIDANDRSSQTSILYDSATLLLLVLSGRTESKVWLLQYLKHGRNPIIQWMNS